MRKLLAAAKNQALYVACSNVYPLYHLNLINIHPTLVFSFLFHHLLDQKLVIQQRLLLKSCSVIDLIHVCFNSRIYML